jgi:hypothetical protein
MLKQEPNEWNSAYQPCLFEVDSYTVLAVGDVAVPTNDSGKLRLDAFVTPYPAVFGTQFVVVKDGIYQGLHKIVSMSTTEILTDTDFISTTANVQVTGAFPYQLNILYGYPVPFKSLKLKTNYGLDGYNVTDVSPALQAMFEIKPPFVGFDENYYTHFRIKIEPGAQLLAYFAATGFTVETFFEYDYLDYKWYVINGWLDNADLATTIAANEIITGNTTIFNACGKVWYTRIIEDRLFNNYFEA